MQWQSRKSINSVFSKQTLNHNMMLLASIKSTATILNSLSPVMISFVLGGASQLPVIRKHRGHMGELGWNRLKERKPVSVEHLWIHGSTGNSLQCGGTVGVNGNDASELIKDR